MENMKQILAIGGIGVATVGAVIVGILLKNKSKDNFKVDESMGIPQADSEEA